MTNLVHDDANFKTFNAYFVLDLTKDGRFGKLAGVDVTGSR